MSQRRQQSLVHKTLTVGNAMSIRIFTHPYHRQSLVREYIKGTLWDCVLGVGMDVSTTGKPNYKNCFVIWMVSSTCLGPVHMCL